MKTNVNFNITWSKFLAFTLIGLSVFLDIRNGGSTTFMFTVPFVVVLITGKQVLDRNKTSE